MCYYDYIRLQCGCRFWGARRKRCREDTTPECGIKRVYKHLYSPRGLYCKTHHLYRVQHALTSIEMPSRPPSLADAANGCATAGCFLLANHCPPHQSWTECADADCHLHSGHEGRHGGLAYMPATTLARMHEENIRRIALQLYVEAALGPKIDTDACWMHAPHFAQRHMTRRHTWGSP